MRRKPANRSQRFAALGLELAGVLAVLYAVSQWSIVAAIALAGALAILIAQFLGELL